MKASGYPSAPAAYSYDVDAQNRIYRRKPVPSLVKLPRPAGNPVSVARRGCGPRTGCTPIIKRARCGRQRDRAGAIEGPNAEMRIPGTAHGSRNDIP